MCEFRMKKKRNSGFRISPITTQNAQLRNLFTPLFAQCALTLLPGYATICKSIRTKKHGPVGSPVAALPSVTLPPVGRPSSKRGLADRRHVMRCITLTVFFQDPFWIGLVQRSEDGAISVAKIVFGAEPSEPQVYAWLMANQARLRFSPPIEGQRAPRMAENPKRRQRQAAKALKDDTGTKSQRALQLARESARTERRTQTKQERMLQQQRLRQIQVDKRKAKHRGH